MARVTGFILLAAAIVGLVAASSSLDQRGAALLSTGNLALALRVGVVEAGGGLRFGLVATVLIAVALVGVGLLLFGKRRE